jgi:hypothetical protein
VVSGGRGAKFPRDVPSQRRWRKRRAIEIAM